MISNKVFIKGTIRGSNMIIPTGGKLLIVSWLWDRIKKYLKKNLKKNIHSEMIKRIILNLKISLIIDSKFKHLILDSHFTCAVTQDKFIIKINKKIKK